MVDKTYPLVKKAYCVNDIVDGRGSREGYRGRILEIADDTFFFWKRKKYAILWETGACCWHYDTDFE